MRKSVLSAFLFVAATLAWHPAARCQERPARPPEFVSPEVTAEKKVAFRVHAPKATTARLTGGDMPGVGGGVDMTKSDAGVWEANVGPLPPGAYRYKFLVDGLAVDDPRNPATSESNATTWSLAYVPGSDISDAKEVPHGAVAEVFYPSSTLKRMRRMHVYTPPGYEKGNASYPVFYLLHGASDSDDSWTTVGRAGFILDNLIAEGKAKPMIVVMPAGHTGPMRPRPQAGSTERRVDEFIDEFAKDIRPYVEKSYRTAEGRANRAIAGLSMGGGQTLNVAIANLGDYGYIGVFSSGVFGIVARPGGGEPNTQWEDEHRATLDDAGLKQGLRLFWIGCGKEDFLVKTSEATAAMLRNHKFDVTSVDSEGGHTWANWRAYLAQFAPLLFKGE